MKGSRIGAALALIMLAGLALTAPCARAEEEEVAFELADVAVDKILEKVSDVIQEHILGVAVDEISDKETLYTKVADAAKAGTQVANALNKACNQLFGTYIRDLGDFSKGVQDLKDAQRLAEDYKTGKFLADLALSRAGAGWWDEIREKFKKGKEELKRYSNPAKMCFIPDNQRGNCRCGAFYGPFGQNGVRTRLATLSVPGVGARACGNDASDKYGSSATYEDKVDVGREFCELHGYHGGGGCGQLVNCRFMPLNKAGSLVGTSGYKKSDKWDGADLSKLSDLTPCRCTLQYRSIPKDANPEEWEKVDLNWTSSDFWFRTTKQRCEGKDEAGYVREADILAWMYQTTTDKEKGSLGFNSKFDRGVFKAGACSASAQPGESSLPDQIPVDPYFAWFLQPGADKPVAARSGGAPPKTSH